MGVNVEETLGSLEDRDAVEGALFEMAEEVVCVGFEGVEEADLREGMMSAWYERKRRSKDLDAGGEEFSHSDALLRMYIEGMVGLKCKGHRSWESMKTETLRFLINDASTGDMYRSDRFLWTYKTPK